MRIGTFCLLGLLLLGAALTAVSAPRVTKVLMVTGDWKSQAWYQDVWMKGGGTKLFRGRYIKQQVDAVAPGQFAFTDVTNYVGQEYMDAQYLSQFDVVLLSDIVGWSLNPRFEAAVEDYVKNGGGLIYCASWKWHCAEGKGTPFGNVLPADFPVSNITDDWQIADSKSAEDNFKPIPLANHPVTNGLDWASVPPIGHNFKIIPKPGSDVLLKSAAGTPTVVAWQLGKGRTVISSSVFANDETSGGFGEWKDFGKYYAQMFAWAGANSTNVQTPLKTVTADATVAVNCTAKPLNTVPAALFSMHGAQDCPGFNPLQGQALDYFNQLNPKGEFARFSANIEPARGKFEFAEIDHQLSEIKRLNMEPLALFAAYAYGQPRWLWADGSNWANPSEQAVKDIVEEIHTFLLHTNGQKGVNYSPVVKYIEVCNEPGITSKTIDGYVKIYTAVARDVHANFPGVKVGGLGGYEIPYVKMFIDRAGPDIDWISRHPYGWTGEMLFKVEDEFQAYARQKGYNQIKFIVTEYDFWIQGRQKFDYMMKRYFEAVQREDCLGTLHYRFGMYNEPIYLFGVMWGGWGQNQGAGPANTPMHDAYDALWAFRDFRGPRVPVTVQAPGVTPQLLNHVKADAVCNGGKVNVVLYYDWAYDGTGYKDYAKGVQYARINTTLQLTLPKSAQARTVTLSSATGEGYKTEQLPVTVAPGQQSMTVPLTLEPLTAYAVTVQ